MLTDQFLHKLDVEFVIDGDLLQLYLALALQPLLEGGQQLVEVAVRDEVVGMPRYVAPLQHHVES